MFSDQSHSRQLNMHDGACNDQAMNILNYLKINASYRKDLYFSTSSSNPISTVSNSAGKYTLTNVPAGYQLVRLEHRTNWQQTIPPRW